MGVGAIEPPSPARAAPWHAATARMVMNLDAILLARYAGQLEAIARDAEAIESRTAGVPRRRRANEMYGRLARTARALHALANAQPRAFDFARLGTWPFVTRSR